MAVNKFFQGGKGIGRRSEQNLVDELIIESIKIYGHDMKYLPRTEVKFDKLLGEDTQSRFDDYQTIEMYCQNTDDFGGAHEFVSKFGGLHVEETADFIMSRTRYHQTFPNSPRPLEGDLVFFPVTSRLFEIKHVEDDYPFFQLSKMSVYVLKCSLFTYSYEDFNTGVSDIDGDLADLKDPFDDTEFINEQAKDDALSFNEDNPFGEIVPKE